MARSNPLRLEAASVPQPCPGPFRLLVHGSPNAGVAQLLDRLRGDPDDSRQRMLLSDAAQPGHWFAQLADALPTVPVVVVDAPSGLDAEAHRLALVASLLGVRQLVLVVNRMARIDWREDAFARLVRQYRRHCEQIGIARLLAVPVDAETGANLHRRSARLPWYRGLPLLERLEDCAPALTEQPLRLRALPCDAAHALPHCARLLAGTPHPGDEVVVLPGAAPSRLARLQYIDSPAGPLLRFALEPALPVSPGDLIATPQARPEVSDQFAAHLLWLDEQPLYPGRRYLLRLGETLVGARVTEIKHRLQPDSLERHAAKRLTRNDLAFCNLAIDRALPFDPSAERPATGTFQLLDHTSQTTIACGMVAFGLRRAANIHRHAMKIDKASRAAGNAQQPCVLWFTGLSGSGKSTVADLVEQRLQTLGKRTMLLDGDNVRHGLNRDLGFTDEDRVENIRRVGEVAKLMVEAGLITLVSFISPFRSERQMVRELLDADEFVEIFVDASLQTCEARDPKGLYKKARAGQLPNFTGIGSPYEAPPSPDLRLPADEETAERLADRVIDHLRQRAMI